MLGWDVNSHITPEPVDSYWGCILATAPCRVIRVMPGTTCHIIKLEAVAASTRFALLAASTSWSSFTSISSLPSLTPLSFRSAECGQGLPPCGKLLVGDQTRFIEIKATNSSSLTIRCGWRCSPLSQPKPRSSRGPFLLRTFTRSP